MKRVRVERWGGSILPPRNPRLLHSTCPFTAQTQCTSPVRSSARLPSGRVPPQVRYFSAATRIQAPARTIDQAGDSAGQSPAAPPARYSPSPSAAAQSAKLAALHARLSLPARFPVQTLARCLVDASADPNPEFNNSSLAVLGQDLLGYYTAEWLLCNHPRLPMPVLFAAQYAYAGPKTLSQMRNEWGVEAAAAPGHEVDAGLLQFKRAAPGNAMAEDGMTRVKDSEAARANSAGTGRSNEQYRLRRGMSSRIVYDDEFGDLRTGLNTPLTPDSEPFASEEAPLSPDNTGVTLETASATFIRAVFGALYLHSGSAATHTFHNSHILSRHLPLHTLFSFKHPTRDLSRLCAREGFEPPVARLISETGRASRSPVFVVGVYSGEEKLGEDAGSSLDEARIRAAAQALRSWYLYSPPRDDVVLPSEVENSASRNPNRQWKPQMVDIGEIVT
ncbi:hypothetical protein MBLNU459_g7679t1 [Dothideomycetes sp. NU459]